MTKKQILAARVGFAAGVLYCLSACGDSGEAAVEDLSTTVDEALEISTLNRKRSACEAVSYFTVLDEFRKDNPENPDSTNQNNAFERFIENCIGKGFCGVDSDTKHCFLNCGQVTSEKACSEFPVRCKIKTRKKKTGRKCVKRAIWCTKYKNVYKNVFDECIQK